MFYIGSSYVYKVKSGYHGSVKSKKYKDIWKSELKDNPHLFKTKIICTTETREQATAIEYRLQKALNVVKSPMYINMALASPNGFFGKPMNGENNPNYGKHTKKIKRTIEHRLNNGNSIAKTYKIYFPRGNDKIPDIHMNNVAIIRNLDEFCRIYTEYFPDHRIHKSAMQSVAKGKIKHHKGFVVNYWG
jgi:hypothetical protein